MCTQVTAPQPPPPATAPQPRPPTQGPPPRALLMATALETPRAAQGSRPGGAQGERETETEARPEIQRPEHRGGTNTRQAQTSQRARPGYLSKGPSRGDQSLALPCEQAVRVTQEHPASRTEPTELTPPHLCPAPAPQPWSRDHAPLGDWTPTGTGGVWMVWPESPSLSRSSHLCMALPPPPPRFAFPSLASALQRTPQPPRTHTLAPTHPQIPPLCKALLPSPALQGPLQALCSSLSGSSLSICNGWPRPGP